MGKGLARKEAALAQALLKHSKEKPESTPFKEPVDYEDLGLNDYPKVVKRPMDLATIRKKLQTSKYHSLRSFHSDLKLIWANCRAYNESSSSITLQANELERSVAEFVEHYNSLERGQWRTLGDPERVTLEEKMEMVMDVRELQRTDLMEVGKIVKAEVPSAFEQLDSDRFRLKLDNISRTAFLRIHSFIKEHVPEPPESKKAKRAA